MLVLKVIMVLPPYRTLYFKSGPTFAAGSRHLTVTDPSSFLILVTSRTSLGTRNRSNGDEGTAP